MKFGISLIFVAFLTISQVYAEAEKKPSEESNNAQQELVDLFFAAARTGNADVIDEFLKHGFPVDVRDSKGYTPLMMATYYGHAKIVSNLLSYGADRCLRDNKGHTALMGAIVKAEWTIAKQLRKVDCDADAQQKGQLTTAEFAEVFGQSEQLKQLVN